MKTLLLSQMALFLLFIGCTGKENTYDKNDLNSVKNDFIKTIFCSEVEEGPSLWIIKLQLSFFQKNSLVYSR